MLVTTAILIALFGAPAALHAQSGEKLYPYVVRVVVWDDNYLRISVQGQFDPLHGCSENSFGRSSHPLDDARTEAMLQVASASFLSHSSVYIHTQGCTPDGQPQIINMQLVPYSPPLATTPPRTPPACPPSRPICCEPGPDENTCFHCIPRGRHCP
jgi:hypothetical protein